jgi:hypothetical protein
MLYLLKEARYQVIKPQKLILETSRKTLQKEKQFYFFVYSNIIQFILLKNIYIFSYIKTKGKKNYTE